MFRNTMPRYEILSEDAMDTLDRGWRRIVSEIGVEFILPEAVEIFRAAGCQHRGRDRLPRSRLRARAGRQGAARVRPAWPATPSARCASAATTWCSRACTGRRSCARATSAARRRWPTSSASSCSRSSSTSSTRPAARSASPTTRPLDSRHLDMVFALQTLSDKLAHGLGHVRPERRRHDRDERDPVRRRARRSSAAPVTISLINVNSPLRFDDRMLAAMLEYNRAEPGRDHHAVPADGRDVAGHRPGVARAADGRGAGRDRAHAARAAGLPGRLRLVPLEHRPAVGLAQLRHARVGDRPALHRPDRAPLRPAVAQRRRPHVEPDGRRPGLLRGADDDAADVPGRRQLRHALGRAGSSRACVSCYEKFIVDIEILRMLQEEFTPLEVDEASLAYGAHQEVGHGGHFLGAAHTLERFRTCFYRPLLSSTENFERWKSKGVARRDRARRRDLAQDARGVRAAARSTRTCAARLRGVRRPPPDRARRLTGTRRRHGRQAGGEHGPARHRDARSRCWRGRRRSRRQGRRVIHLEIGEPDFATPGAHRRGGRARAARRPHPLLPGARAAGAARGVRRAPVRAPRPRRSTRAAWWSRPGAKPFLFFGVLATCDPGDEVIYPEPRLPDLRVGDPLRRARRRCRCRSSRSAGFAFTADDLAERLTPRTRLVILNSPANPTGGIVAAAS